MNPNENTKEQALTAALSALKNGLGYEIENIKGAQFVNNNVGRARRIFCQYLKRQGFENCEIAQILQMSQQKADLYVWRKKQVERKDMFQREKKQFELALKRINRKTDNPNS